MSTKGRRRLTAEEIQARVADYCRRYQVLPNAAGLPPFPSGKRETMQHREWLLVYKAHQRMARRLRGQCERCEEPAEDGSIFCRAHRGGGPAPAAEAEGPGPHATRATRDGAHCPICRRSVAAAEARPHVVAGRRSALHEGCRELVERSERAGREQLDRVRSYLWPKRRGRP